MITNNSFDCAQYYKKTIVSILLKENAFKPLDEAMNYIINHSTEYQSMIKSYSYNKTDKFVIVLDANSNKMLIGNYTNNCVALKIDYTKKNTKLNKLFGKLIRSEVSWKNTRDEFIKLIISYFDKQYKEIYEKSLNNVILDSNQYDYFPFPCKDVQEILNQLKKTQIRKTDVNRNLLNYFISYFITDQSNYDYLLSFLNNYDLLEIYFTFNWVQFLYSQDRQENINKILDNPHAFDELENLFETFYDHPDGLKEIFEDKKYSELVLAFNFDSKTVVVNDLRGKCVKVSIYAAKKNKKIYKLFALLIEGKEHFSNIKEEIINCFKEFFNQKYKDMYKMQLDNILLTNIISDSEKVYPITNKIIINDNILQFLIKKINSDKLIFFRLFKNMTILNIDFNCLFDHLPLITLINLHDYSSSLDEVYVNMIKNKILKLFSEMIQEKDFEKIMGAFNYAINSAVIVTEFIALLENNGYEIAKSFGSGKNICVNNFLLTDNKELNHINFLVLDDELPNINLYVKDNDYEHILYMIKLLRAIKYIKSNLNINLIKINSNVNTSSDYFIIKNKNLIY